MRQTLENSFYSDDYINNFLQEFSGILYTNITLFDIDADSSNEIIKTFKGDDLIYSIKKAPGNLIIRSNWTGEIKQLMHILTWLQALLS